MKSQILERHVGWAFFFFSVSENETCACILCSSAARFLRGVSVFVVRTGENMPAVSLYCH